MRFKRREDSCTGRILIVFSRKPTDVMEYRRSGRRIMSKTNEARRNKRPSSCLARARGRVRAGVAVLREKWRANFPALAPSSSRFSPPSRLRSRRVLLPHTRARKGGKGRRRVVKCGRETTAGRHDGDDGHGGDDCEWGRGGSILLHSSSLGFRAVASWRSRTSRSDLNPYRCYIVGACIFT